MHGRRSPHFVVLAPQGLAARRADDRARGRLRAHGRRARRSRACAAAISSSWRATAPTARALTERHPRRRVARRDLRRRGQRDGRGRARRARSSRQRLRRRVAAVQRARRRRPAARRHPRAHPRRARRRHLRPHAGVAGRGHRALRLRRPPRRRRRARCVAGEAAAARAPRADAARALRARRDRAARRRRPGRRLRLRSAAAFYIADRFGRKRCCGSTTPSTTRTLPGPAGRRRSTDRGRPARRSAISLARARSATCATGSVTRGRSRTRLSLGRCPSCPRSRRSAATWRPHVEGRTLRARSRSSTRAGAGRSRPRELAAAVEGRASSGSAAAASTSSGSSPTTSTCSLHLRMTGTLLLDPPERPPHTRVRFDLGDARARCSSTRAASAPASSRSAPDALDAFFAARLGVEPLEPEFTGEHLYALAQTLARADQGVPARPEARSPASATSTPTRRCSAPASTRCGRPNRLTRAQCAALRDAVVASLEAGHRGQGRHDRRLPRPLRRQRHASRTSFLDPPARGRAVRALRHARCASCAPPGAGPTSASAASRGRGSALRGCGELARGARRGRPRRAPGSRRAARRR